jgi:hypothetical protein
VKSDENVSSLWNAGARSFDVSIAAGSAHDGTMDRAMNYSFWALALLMTGAIVLATLVW